MSTELTLTLSRSTEKVADRVLEKEKDRQVGQVFNAAFSWQDMLDAMADVYLGVSLMYS